MPASTSPFAEVFSHPQQGREEALLQRLLVDPDHPVAEHECREHCYGSSSILAVQRWGSAESNAEGQYRIAYTALAALRAEKASADVGLRSHTADVASLGQV